MKMEKRKFRIGTLAEQLNVERFVIRFWEKEFNFKGRRSGGGQRFYDEDDLKKFKTIKELLYEKKFTIAGAKQFFQRQHTHSLIASSVTVLEAEETKKGKTLRANSEQFSLFHKKLYTLRQLLIEFKKSIY